MPRRQGAGTQNKAMQAKIAAKFGATSSRTGGRGSVRRKFKAPPKSSAQDDKRLQGQLKKLNVNLIPAIEEVNLFKDDNTVVHFTKPKVQAEISSNTYVISGQCETKKLEELIPQILPQLGREHIDSLKDFANSFNQMNPEVEDEDDVPVLVDDNFEAVASSDVKTETETEKTDDATANENNDATQANDATDATAADDTNAAADTTDDKQESANDATDTAVDANADDVPDLVDPAAETAETVETDKPTADMKPDPDQTVAV